MKILSAPALGVGVVVAMFVAAPGIATPPDGHPQGRHGSDTTTVHDCEDASGDRVGTVTYDGPETMWPPNHKYRDLTVVAKADDDDATVTLATEGLHDEVAEDGAEMNGAGNTEDDVDPAMAMDGPNSGSATTSHGVRSERSGRGDGRTYTITYEAEFDDTVCVDEFTIEVPHSQGQSADNKKVHTP